MREVSVEQHQLLLALEVHCEMEREGSRAPRIELVFSNGLDDRRMVMPLDSFLPRRKDKTGKNWIARARYTFFLKNVFWYGIWDECRMHIDLEFEGETYEEVPFELNLRESTFKAKAVEAGYGTIACSSTGNAASSLAGNAAAAGLASVIFVPERAPVGKVAQLLIFGAKVLSVRGTYEDTFELSRAAIDRYGWYNRNAAINPYLMEGKKTVSLEIAEQLGWRAPDYVALSVGDGCTIAGVWKGFRDLYEAGFIDRLPRLISAQAEKTCPINRAARTGEPWQPMEENTLADSISVGVPRNPDKAIRAIRESDGITVEVSDDEILAAMRCLGRTCGVFGEPAGVTGTAGLMKLCAAGRIPADAEVVSIVTGNGLKDTANAARAAGEPIRVRPDPSLLEGLFGKPTV